MGMVMDLSDHVVVLNFGQVIASGIPAEVQANPEVIRASPRYHRFASSACWSRNSIMTTARSPRP
jgi:ABC-type antimicrobial peptide transport system ATPase subunit